MSASCLNSSCDEGSLLFCGFEACAVLVVLLCRFGIIRRDHARSAPGIGDDNKNSEEVG